MFLDRISTVNGGSIEQFAGGMCEESFEVHVYRWHNGQVRCIYNCWIYGAPSKVAGPRPTRTSLASNHLQCQQRNADKTDNSRCDYKGLRSIIKAYVIGDFGIAKEDNFVTVKFHLWRQNAYCLRWYFCQGECPYAQKYIYISYRIFFLRVRHI